MSKIMQMDQNIRVKIEQKYKGIYNGLKGYAIGDFHELFYLCTCIGYKYKRSIPVQKKDDCFHSRSILTDEWYVYYSLFLAQNEMDFSKLSDDQILFDELQEYANGGMEFLIEEFLTDYVKIDSNGSYIIDNKYLLPKELLMTVLEWSE